MKCRILGLVVIFALAVFVAPLAAAEQPPRDVPTLVC